jgi:hypothetical protein
LSNEISSLIGSSALAGAQFIGTYFLPVEDFYILITGEDFNGLKSNIYAAGAFLLLEVLPGGKVLKPVANLLGDATKFFFKYGDDFLDLVKISGVVKFTDNSIQKLARVGTKNATKTKVLLGKLNYLNTLSYIDRAGKDYKYFDIDYWDDVSALVNNNKQEIFKINKQFIDDALSQRNTIYLSHNPFDPLIRDGYFEMELDYIENVLRGKIKSVEPDLWIVEF